MGESGNSLLLIASLLVLAKASAAVSSRLGMPSVLGMLVAGLICGPAVLHLVRPDAFVNDLAEIGIILLMFIVGLETDPGELRRVGRSAFFVAVGGVLLPLGAGFMVGKLAGMQQSHALFLGAILTATSVSITAETLKDLGRLNSREGSIILGAAIIDDVLGVIVLSALVVAENNGSILLPLLRLVLFSAGAFVVGKWVLPWLLPHHERLGSDDTRVALAIGLALLLAWAAAKLGGLADITGAFLAGLMISESGLGRVVTAPVSRLGYAFFIPIFFMVIGSAVTTHDLISTPWLTVIVIIVALATKLLGCGLPSLACGESLVTSLRVGTGMVSRGEVALVVASAGLADGLVDHDVYALAIVMTVVTTVAAPLMLKGVYARRWQRTTAGVPDVAEAPALVADLP
jgi:Kef-type K+ transport system membrane component KefB